MLGLGVSKQSRNVDVRGVDPQAELIDVVDQLAYVAEFLLRVEDFYDSHQEAYISASEGQVAVELFEVCLKNELLEYLMRSFGK